MERLWRVPTVETDQIIEETDEGPKVRYVEVDIEDAFDEAMAEAANLISTMNRLGGAVTIVPDRRQVGWLGDEPEMRTYGFVFRWNSNSPIQRQPREREEPEPEPTPEPEPVAAEAE
jgi:hypothetical protein